MEAERTRDFPLFPLGIVALPGEAVPLHIFEPRYRAMMADCLERDSEFGIVWLGDEGLAEVGCACAVEQVLERMDDGRMNLVARGTRPFRILARQEDLPYPAGAVEFLPDAEEEPDDVATETARTAYADLVEHVTDRRPAVGELGELSAYGMAGRVDFGPEPKQELLEERSENARLARVARLLDAARTSLDASDRAQARARSNGKVRFNA